MPDPRFVGHLHTATAVFHAVADADLISACRSITGYREYLEKSYGFELGVERAFSGTRELGTVIDLDVRSRVPALIADLEMLGVHRPVIEALPVWKDRAGFDELVEALGWMFVLDRRSVAPGIAARELARDRPMMTKALSYFARIAARPTWGTLVTALENVEADPRASIRLLDAASDGFRARRAWFHDRN
jgi:heme oxygenase